ncbi:MAG: nuclear transport factor 2 family protein [Pseudomonadota bacterium]
MPHPDTRPGEKAKTVVEDFLRIIMIPDPVGARIFVSPELQILFTGGREMKDPADCSAFNASRYAWVKKRFERTDVVAGATEEEAVVYNIGTLHGAWLDGTPFEGNRYVDRYVVSHGLITQMQVWNDSAEWLLVRAGLADAWPSPMAHKT